MCGIAGVICTRRLETAVNRVALSMVGQLKHRGPDSDGVWSDQEFGIGLAHRRLSIIDLSENGHQPMVSTCGRFVLSFNGEIYNFQLLRKRLEAEQTDFRGHSDTEVFLNLCVKLGVKEACNLANGMFAFALWDRSRKELSLGRDRFGQKPLYYGLEAGNLFFASELKAFGAIPGFAPAISPTARSLYFRHGYIPAPLSIYENIQKVMPGSIIRVQANRIIKQQQEIYWSATKAAEISMQNPLGTDNDENQKKLEDALTNSVRHCMVSDVPIGCFLSGGIDSSLVAALMQSQTSEKIRTFSIGFAEGEYDESTKAASVAARLNTNHTMVRVTARDAINTIPVMPTVFDEPFADASQIPTYILSQLTRHSVKVALSGDGGDELFCGYSRYLWAGKIAKLLNCPLALRKIFSFGLMQVPPQFLNHLNKIIRSSGGQLGDKVHKVAAVIGESNISNAYLRLISFWNEAQAFELSPTSSPILESFDNLPQFDLYHRMMLTDTLHYLPDDILVKVDRASMASSLETRIPLLDHNLFELAWRLGLSEKLNQSRGKLAIRKILNKWIGPDLTNQPKMGFSLPIDKWLRNELREWAEALIEPKLLRDNQIDPYIVHHVWSEHLSGKRNWQHKIWSILMYQMWANTRIGQSF